MWRGRFRWRRAHFHVVTLGDCIATRSKDASLGDRLCACVFMGKFSRRETNESSGVVRVLWRSFVVQSSCHNRSPEGQAAKVDPQKPFQEKIIGRGLATLPTSMMRRVPSQWLQDILHPKTVRLSHGLLSKSSEETLRQPKNHPAQVKTGPWILHMVTVWGPYPEPFHEPGAVGRRRSM